jgi:hypothetical protein
MAKMRIRGARQTKVRSGVEAVLVALLTSIVVESPAHSETLGVKEKCGDSQSEIQLAGGGWAWGGVVCEYRYFYNGAPLGLPDHEHTQPSYQFVPTGDPGEKKVRAELWTVDEVPVKRQCREVDFQLVAEEEDDPWRNEGFGQISAYGVDDCINFKFDPEGVCKIDECEKIGFLQIVRVQGWIISESAPFSDEWYDLSNTDWFLDSVSLDHAMHLDSETFFGWHVDYFPGSADPYLQTDGTGKFGAQAPPLAKAAEAWDRPNMNQSKNGVAFPRLQEVVFTFHTAARCLKGEKAGEWLGTTIWKATNSFWYGSGAWEVEGVFQNKTKIETLGHYDPGAPDIVKTVWEVSRALNGWPEPQPHPSTKGGRPCN